VEYLLCLELVEVIAVLARFILMIEWTLLAAKCSLNRHRVVSRATWLTQLFLVYFLSGGAAVNHYKGPALAR